MSLGDQQMGRSSVHGPAQGRGQAELHLTLNFLTLFAQVRNSPQSTQTLSFSWRPARWV